MAKGTNTTATTTTTTTINSAGVGKAIKISKNRRYGVSTRPYDIEHIIDKHKKQRKSAHAIAVLCKTADIIMLAYLKDVQENLSEHETLNVQHLAAGIVDEDNATHGIFKNRFAGIYQPRRALLQEQDKYPFANEFEDDNDNDDDVKQMDVADDDDDDQEQDDNE